MSTGNTKNNHKQRRHKETMPGTRIVFTPEGKRQITKLIDERINEAHVTKEDFSELKSIVQDIAVAQKELVEAQKRTKARLEQLAEAQKQTKVSVEQLAEAQKRTEMRLEELSQAPKQTKIEVKKLAIGWHEVRVELGSLSRSVRYAFENEAYRYLPKLLKEKYGYDLVERMVRADIGGNKINFFAKAVKDGKEFYIVG